MKELLNEFTELEQQTSPEISVVDFLMYMEKELPFFTISNSYSKIISKKKQNETHHTSALVTFMLKNQNRYTLVSENAQKSSSKADIAVYNRITDEIILIIEAKILPIPTDKNRQAYEYVYNDKGNGGIERFKKNQHGLDNSDRLLAVNAILAYIKADDFDYWFSKINKWINDAGWQSSELLKKIYFNEIAKLTSEHTRIDNSGMITLHHFWVKVVVN